MHNSLQLLFLKLPPPPPPFPPKLLQLWCPMSPCCPASILQQLLGLILYISVRAKVIWNSCFPPTPFFWHFYGRNCGFCLGLCQSTATAEEKKRCAQIQREQKAWASVPNQNVRQRGKGINCNNSEQVHIHPAMADQETKGYINVKRCLLQFFWHKREGGKIAFTLTFKWVTKKQHSKLSSSNFWFTAKHNNNR